MKTRYTYRFEPFGTLCYDGDLEEIYIDYDISKFSQEDTRVVDNRYFNAPQIAAPINVFLEITENCNSKCIHCINSREEKSNDFSLDEIKTIIDKLYISGVFLIKISGGEPFYRDDIFEILNYIELKGIKYIIYTNGTYINRETVSRLQSYNCMSCVRVSIDGMKETNDAIRGNGMFNTAINALQLLSTYGISCEANYTICYKNYQEISSLSSYIKNANIKAKINIGTLKVSGGVLKNRELIIPQDKTEMVMNNVKLQIANNDMIAPYKLLPEVYFRVFSKAFGCPAGRLSMSINNCGNVYGCGMFSDSEKFNCGNLIHNSLNGIWNSEKMNFIRRLSAREDCMNCASYQKKCTGACRGNALNYFGDITESDINCAVYKYDYICY